MRDVGTYPMIEATYLRNTRLSMGTEESVARSQNSHVVGMCVRRAAVGHQEPKVCLVMAVNSKATDRHTLASLHMPRYASEKQPRFSSDRLIVT